MERVGSIRQGRPIVFERPGWGMPPITKIRRRCTMGEDRCRLVGVVDDEKGDRAIHCMGIRSSWKRIGSLAVGLLSMLTLLEPWPLVPVASAQDTPAKSEAPVQPVVPQDLAPAEAAQDPLTGSAEALSVRYRFTEKYTVKPDPDHPERLSQYRVGMLETQKAEREKPQGAPERFQFSRLTKYTEAPAQVGSKLGEVITAIRRYDTFRMKETSSTRSPKKPLFEGLTILNQRRPGQPPQFLSLTSDHPLREFEFAEMNKHVFVPQLTSLFAPTPQRMGDTWRISREKIQCIVNEIPDTEDYEMTGRLVEVRKSGTGTSLTAVIGISGQMNLSHGKSMLNAQIHFVFEPTSPPRPLSDSVASAKTAESTAVKARSKRDEGIVDARGMTSRLLMAWVASTPLEDGDGRFKETVTYELDLERRLVPATNDATGTQNTLLTIPDPLPTADESNSWVLYEDPLERFHFRHPQELRLEDRMPDPDNIGLVDHQLRGSDILAISLQQKETSPERARQIRDPDFHRRTLYSNWEKQKTDMVRGSSGWLPDAEWSPLKRKVYRIEAALKQNGPDATTAPRVYCDYYLVLFTTNESIVVTAMTVQDPHVAYRNQAEAVIKSFQFGPSDAATKRGALPLTPPE
jgi:hypothetical protein